MKNHEPLKIVIKLGTSSVVDEETHQPMLPVLSHIVGTAVKLHNSGHKVIIVSSGAIGVGLKRMNYEKRPKHSAKVQALAAIGQCRLITLWDQLFGHCGQPIAQILLTRNDIADRTQYLNAQNTFRELLEMGVIPIVNENDTIAVSEIKFGDNDTLSAITAAMVHANYLFLMTDVDCLYDKNPRSNADARAIEVVDDISALQADVSTAGSSLGTGGMCTKIVAARLASSAGVTTIITRSSNPGNIIEILEYLLKLKSQNSTPIHSPSSASPLKYQSPSNEEPSKFQDSTVKINPGCMIAPLHTRFIPSKNPIRDRQFWLLHGLSPRGTLFIDAGAFRALENKAGLFAVGVIDVEGSFAQLEAVRIVVIDREKENSSLENSSESNCKNMNNFKLSKDSGTEVGRALVSYSAAEIARIKGVGSSEIHHLLGYADSEYVARRGNISLFTKPNVHNISRALDL